MKHLSILIIVIAITACVSVTLKTESNKPAEGLSYQAPSDPFEKVGDKNYPSWIQKKSGNIISLVSECGSQDLSLTQLQNEVLTALDESKVLKEEKVSFDNREALKTWIQGKTNGVDTKLLVMVFKKNSCNYTLSYGGKEKNFEKDIAAFDRFTTSLRIP